MWFKWKNPDIDPSRSFEFMNAFELWGPHPHLRDRGAAKLPLQRYPFDTQDLVVAFENTTADDSKVVFVPDRRPVALSKDLTLPGWKFGDPTLELVGNRYDTDFGDPTAADPVYSRAVVTVPVVRPRGPTRPSCSCRCCSWPSPPRSPSRCTRATWRGGSASASPRC